MGPIVQELKGVIVEGEEIQSIQDAQRSELRETNRRARDLRCRGRSLRNKLAAGVQSVFGGDSMALLAFGVKPRLPKPRQVGSGARGGESCEGCGRKEEGLMSL